MARNRYELDGVGRIKIVILSLARNIAMAGYDRTNLHGGSRVC